MHYPLRSEFNLKENSEILVAFILRQEIPPAMASNSKWNYKDGKATFCTTEVFEVCMDQCKRKAKYYSDQNAFNPTGRSNGIPFSLP
jgi:hypothetical protein